MNIIVPIHVEALRVSPSNQQIFTQAIYDFSELNNTGISTQSEALNPAYRIGHTSEPLGSGIHLHWSLPKTYTRGIQQANGSILFPHLPNRWLITRFLKKDGDTTNHIKMWILEGDAHDSDPTNLNGSKTQIPWMQDVDDLTGLKTHSAGRTIVLTDKWTEPGGVPSAYLGKLLQAPFAYGTSFTAFYQNCGNIFGLYDDLKPAIQDYENNCHFTASYSVIGWVSEQAEDICYQELQAALKDYQPINGKPDFTTYIKEIFETKLKWSLSDYSGFTQSNLASTQTLISGTIADIKWDLDNAASTYPSAIPGTTVDPNTNQLQNDKIQVSIGNNTSEALSAWLNKLEGGKSDADPAKIADNYEWLLNALQMGQLQHLGNGEQSVAQLDEYLHNKSFGSTHGGYRWTVRHKMNPGSKAEPKDPIEATLPLPLAKILSQLNKAQHEYDAILDEIHSRQDKLFADWSYYMGEVFEQVVKENNFNNLDQIKSHAYLVNGMQQLFETFIRAGSFGNLTITNQASIQEAPGLSINPQDNTLTGPALLIQLAQLDYVDANATYQPSRFNIKIPSELSDLPTGLTSFVFNKQGNKNAAKIISQLQDLQYILEGTIPNGVNSIFEQLKTARLLLEEPSSYTKQVLTLLGAAKKTATTLRQSYTQLNNATNGINALSQKINQTNSPLNEVIASITKYLSMDASNPGTFVAGKSFSGGMGDTLFYNYSTWSKPSSTSFKGIKDLMERLSVQDTDTVKFFDTQLAALYLGLAYFWGNSPDNAFEAVYYYIQMAQDQVNKQLTTAKEVSTSLKNAVQAIGQSPQSSIGKTIKGISDAINHLEIGIAQVIDDLAHNNVKAAIKHLDANLVKLKKPTLLIPLPNLIQELQSSAWKELIGYIEKSWKHILASQSKAYQVFLLNTYLNTKIKGENLYEVHLIPAEKYWHPNEPVVLFGEEGTESGLLKAVDRNGKSSILPCRLGTEVIKKTGTAFPSPLSTLSSVIDPKIGSLNSLIQSLVEESYLLSPKYGNFGNATIAEANQKNTVIKADQTQSLNAAPSGLTGKMPYHIAYNWRKGIDTFLPLFVYWEGDYVFSNPDFSQTNGKISPDFMSSLQLDEYQVDYQPVTEDNLGQFIPTAQETNVIKVDGLIPLSSASTANICHQIENYCDKYLDGYQPNTTPTPGNEEEIKFNKVYTDYKQKHILAQGLSGFNTTLLQRLSELQLPVNIPNLWVSGDDSVLETTHLWPTLLLFNQSKDLNSANPNPWPVNWNDLGIHPNTFKKGENHLSFNPLRAGFLKLTGIRLLDAFGRSVIIRKPNPQNVAESMHSQPKPVGDLAEYPAYLPPRLIQPSRLDCKWLSAESPDSMEGFTEWNPHPASSPICGWFLPNHLDDSLAIYDSKGTPMGSLRHFEQEVKWYQVPGEAVPSGRTSSQQLFNSGAFKTANPHFQGFLEKFVFGAQQPLTNFQTFLQVLDESRKTIVTKNLQEDQGLAVLIGQPLVLVRAKLHLTLKGLPVVSLDHSTIPDFSSQTPSTIFQMDDSKFIPYNFDNFNDFGITQLNVPIKIGTAAYQNKQMKAPIPYFNDGLIGFFKGTDFSGPFYTPLAIPAGNGANLVSTSTSKDPISLQPNGTPIDITMIMDPRAAVHFTTGILPVQSIKLSPDQYQQTLNKLMISFLAAPILKANPTMRMPIPKEVGYDWFWAQIGQEDERIKSVEVNTKAFFPDSPQEIMDGWLKLKKR